MARWGGEGREGRGGEFGHHDVSRQERENSEEEDETVHVAFANVIPDKLAVVVEALHVTARVAGEGVLVPGVRQRRVGISRTVRLEGGRLVRHSGVDAAGEKVEKCRARIQREEAYLHPRADI